ncbi:hypothetical protein [Paenibacillus macerans]|uniref:hypothetical protein n=1 Tax=Paenibacillus macerans TaxID=44252 RepID=UPI000EC6B639|nr:hypothetical protein [Paenibacillus macerans]GBK72560.1 hypothetical protein PbJCM17693_62680 [Paenibacillus macerans]
MEGSGKNISASQELLGACESFKMKVNQVYRANLISSGLYSKLMSKVKEVHTTIKTDVLTQELKYERAGGRFIEPSADARGMFVREKK